MTDHKTLAQALAAAQAEYPEVEKTAKANYGKYATLDSLIAKTRPVLNAHGISVQQFPAVTEFGPVLRTIIRHVSGELEQADTPLFMGKQDMQALGAAITYARRYAWSAALGIASEHDDDAQSIVEKPAVKPAPKPAPAPADAALVAARDKLQELADRLGAGPATKTAIDKNRGTADEAGWLGRAIEAAETNLAKKAA